MCGKKFGHGEVMMVHFGAAGVLSRASIFKFEAWPHLIEIDLATSTTHPRSEAEQVQVVDIAGQRLGSSPVK